VLAVSLGQLACISADHMNWVASAAPCDLHKRLTTRRRPASRLPEQRPSLLHQQRDVDHAAHPREQ